MPIQSIKQPVDFVGFTFNGKHSYRDLNVYRVSSSNRYSDNIAPTPNDIVTAVSGLDGQMLFNTSFKQIQFTLNLAFDSLTEKGLRLLKQTFATKDLSELVFDEQPYKAWDVKVTGTPNIKYVPFDYKTEGAQTYYRIYKGEATIQVVAYNPYAHTPKYVWDNSGALVTASHHGRILTDYSDTYYLNKDRWSAASGLTNNLPMTAATTNGQGSWINNGDLKSNFTITATATSADRCLTNGDYTAKVFITNDQTVTRTVGEISFSLPTLSDNTDFISSVTWDSKTGLVWYITNSHPADKIIIGYTGNTLVQLPVSYRNNNDEPITSYYEIKKGVNYKACMIDYDYWYI